MGSRYSVSLISAIQATGLLTITPAGLTPAEHASLSWTHNRTGEFLTSGSSVTLTIRVTVYTYYGRYGALAVGNVLDIDGILSN